MQWQFCLFVTSLVSFIKNDLCVCVEIVKVYYYTKDLDFIWLKFFKLKGDKETLQKLNLDSITRMKIGRYTNLLNLLMNLHVEIKRNYVWSKNKNYAFKLKSYILLIYYEKHRNSAFQAIGGFFHDFNGFLEMKYSWLHFEIMSKNCSR